MRNAGFGDSDHPGFRKLHPGYLANATCIGLFDFFYYGNLGIPGCLATLIYSAYIYNNRISRDLQRFLDRLVT